MRDRARWALVALALATFVFVTGEVLPVGLLTVMGADLHRSPSAMGLAITGYAVVVVLASVPLTRVTRRVPRRTLLGAALGAFVVGTALTALAPGYSFLLVARLLVALAQAVFWSVVAPAATALFPPAVRGRVVTRLATGTALAPVLGIPAGTWLGQQAGWRVAFLVAAGLGLVIGTAVAVLLPGGRPPEGDAARGPTPDGRRYAVLLVATTVAVTGFLTAYTYITPYLLQVSAFRPGALGPLLFVSGTAGIVGTVAVGGSLDKRPRAALAVPLLVLTAALGGLFALGDRQPAAVVAMAVADLAFNAFAAATQNRTLQVAPGSTDLASAGTGSAFNVGIAGGSLLGGALLDGPGVRSVALAGACLTAAALVVLAAETRFRPRVEICEAAPTHL